MRRTQTIAFLVTAVTLATLAMPTFANAVSVDAAKADALRDNDAANRSAKISPGLPVKSPVFATKRAKLLKQFGPSALEYLEGLRGKTKPYLAPSEIDPRYTLAFYVNVSGRGKRAQRMWVLQRDRIGGPWRLGMSDKRYWQRKGLPASVTPPYSWLVSTGRKYAGDDRSGPTPVGVFSMDERRGRTTRGYRGPGMIHAMFIDLHYRSGRRSGVAFHGTTRGRYRRLGRIDSHGCIRMTQSNALALLKRLRGTDNVLPEHLRWGEVPRFWSRERGRTRIGYRRDGRAFAVEGEPLVVEQQVASLSDEGVATPIELQPVLTKTGYRAIAIMFRD